MKDMDHTCTIWSVLLDRTTQFPLDAIPNRDPDIEPSNGLDDVNSCSSLLQTNLPIDLSQKSILL